MKTSLFRLLSLSVVLVLILVACRPPSAATPQPAATDPASAEPTPIATPAPPEPTPTATPAPETLPTDFVELLDAKIASGEWTEEKGLITLLKHFAGEIHMEDASLDRGLLETEGFGIMNLAVEYLKTGTDEAAKAEITRLLNILVPSQAALDRYSIPAEQANRRPAGLAAPIRQRQDCAALWAAGFPDTRATSFPCFMYGERSVAGQRFRVYYPLAWRDRGLNATYENTLDAVAASLRAFQAYGTIRPIYVVFTTLNHPTDLTTLAATYPEHFRPGEACPVIVYPEALNLTPGEFQQTIAHEVFHCFQSWNLREQVIGAGYRSSKWWVEGAAEYFGNLVYPSVNDEYSFADSFAIRSKTEPLTEMDYENFIFFQHLGNRLGPAGVITFLRRMPVAPGSERQLAALAATPGIEDLWEEFARGVVDQTIRDSDGSLARIPESFSSVVTINGNHSVMLIGNPFVLARHRIVFRGEKQYAIVETSEGPGRSAAQLRGTRAWRPMPATISNCSEREYLLYTLTTTPNAQRAVTLSATVNGDLSCDRCIFGQWRSTPESLLEYFRSVIPPSGGGSASVRVEAVTGAMVAEFREDGTAMAGYDNLRIHQTLVDTSLSGSSVNADIFIQFSGTTSGTYNADGTNLITTFASGSERALVVTVETYANGQFMGRTTMSVRPEDFPLGASVPFRYTCTETTLTVWIPVPSISNVAPIEFRRVSP